jgi:hypothetical protein
MKNKVIQNLVYIKHLAIYKKWNYLSKLNQSKFRINPESQFVVSIASYPKRDSLLPAVFEALSKQTVVPQKWILVISTEEYPNGLPQHLIKLENRGIQILWVENNPFAVKKLIPVIEKFPETAIVTLDDDIIYNKNLLFGLLNFAENNPNSIIGYVGKALLKNDKELHMYFREKSPANLNTPSNQVYLIGWGGVFYPPNSLHSKVLDKEKIHIIVPGRGSDIWFWAAAIANNTKQICLGLPERYNLGIPIPLNNNTQPKDQPKTDVLLNRFQMAIDFFGIRKTLIATLPNQ